MGNRRPLFGFSDTWELVINTGTTIITFLMVFVLQNSQNRDGKAMQAKLDELILASKARNEYVGVEKLGEQELKSLIKSLDKAAESSAAVLPSVEVIEAFVPDPVMEMTNAQSARSAL